MSDSRQVDQVRAVVGLVLGEEDPGRLVEQADVVGAVAGGVEHGERPVAELDPVAVGEQPPRLGRRDVPAAARLDRRRRPLADPLLGPDQKPVGAVDLEQPLVAGPHPRGQLRVGLELPVGGVSLQPLRRRLVHRRGREQAVAADVVEMRVRVDDLDRAPRHRGDRGRDVGDPEPGVEQDRALRARDQPAEHVPGFGDQMQPRLHRGDLEPVVGRVHARDSDSLGRARPIFVRV